MSLGRAAWKEARTTLQKILSKDEVNLRIIVNLFFYNFVVYLQWYF